MKTSNLMSAALTGLFAFAVPALVAAPDDRQYGFIDGFLVQHEERLPERDTSFGGRIGLGFPIDSRSSARTALEFGVFTNPIKTKGNGSETQGGVMLDLVQHYDLGPVSPFIGAGVGAVQEFSGNHWALEALLGAAIRINDDIGVRVGLSAQNVRNNELRPDQDVFTDFRVFVGLTSPFGELAAAAPPKPADADADGVPDQADRCPAQAAPTVDGCPAPLAPAEPPRDTDGDGIDDSKDECPGTLEGLKVDASGCVTSADAQTIVLKGVTFLAGSAELTPEAKTVLDDAYDALAGQTNLKVEVGGHTDSSGADAVNLALSQRRAESVRQYLIGKGIAGDRLVAKGYGEAQPVADNKTAQGRSTNRRVELKILN